MTPAPRSVTVTVTFGPEVTEPYPVTEWLMVTLSLVLSPSLTGVTVTVWRSFQSPVFPPVKVSAPETVAAPSSPDEGVTTTLAPLPGSVCSFTR